MTNMKHKSADAKRMRRTRHKRALEPIVRKFGCTQMEAASRITSTLSDNESLRKQADEKDAAIRTLREDLKEQKELVALERANNERQATTIEGLQDQIELIANKYQALDSKEEL